jgi:hypothetical protein
LVAAALLIAGNSALAQFSGYFSGYYAPANWTKLVSNNASYDNSGYVYTGGAPGSIEIDGAVSAMQQSSSAQLPVSIIDYRIVLQGSGLEPVAFGYIFYGLADGYDAAQLLYYNASGAQVAASLSTVLGVHQTFNGQALGGHTLDFQVYSNNDNAADRLIICGVPEPSTLTFLALGVGALLWTQRRQQS